MRFGKALFRKMPNEPLNTAILLATFGALMIVSVLFSRASERIGVPVALIFLIIGMAAGSEGVLGIPFDDFAFAFRLGTVALVMILFDGGLNTPLSAIRQGVRPAALLATAGVVGTAALVAVGARLLGLPWEVALLIGAIVSSTDAAAVFAVLRGSGLQLKRRVGITLEMESGLNDPVAIILTMALTANLIAPGALGWGLLINIPLQLAIGGALGVGIGISGRTLLQRFRLSVGGLYPAMTLAIATLAFSIPTIFLGSGFLAVYIAAVIIGNADIPYRSGILRVHDAIAWFGQVTMFLMLGLLAYPSQLLDVLPEGILLGLFLAFVARPAVVFPLLLPFRYPLREMTYVSWVGLRGAVPIILASYPVLSAAPGAQGIFNLVLLMVVVNALVPGGTVPWVTRWLGMESGEPPAPPAVLEMTTMQPVRGEIMSFHVSPALAVSNATLTDLPFPEGAAVMLIVRGDELVPPRGNTELLPGDHVHVFCRPEDRDFLMLMFGRPEE
jgi:potassium/hydrogen antiporter